MFPTFHDKEYVLTNVVGMHFEKPNLGDVVVFKAPNDEEKDYIKRIIGIPGDLVMISNGNVFVNGKQLDETVYLSTEVKTYGGSFMQEGQSVNVPESEYLVMGDNRPGSSDSRQWGFIKVKDIIGKSFFVYLPFDRIRLLKNPYN